MKLSVQYCSQIYHQNVAHLVHNWLVTPIYSLPVDGT